LPSSKATTLLDNAIKAGPHLWLRLAGRCISPRKRSLRPADHPIL